MTRLQYVLVAAGAIKPRTDGRTSHGEWQAVVEPGQLVFVKASTKAYWRGAPVPEVVPGAPKDATLLGVLARMPVTAGSNFGVPLAVLTVVVQGPCELRPEVSALAKSWKIGWNDCGGRRILYSGQHSPTPYRIILQ